MEYDLNELIDLLKEENFYDYLNNDNFFSDNSDFMLNLSYFNSNCSDFIDYLSENNQFIDVIYNNLLKLYPFTQNLIKNILNFKLVKYPDLAFVDVVKTSNGLYNFLNEYKKDLSFTTTKSFNDLNYKVEKLKDEIESKNVFEKQWYFIETIKNLLNDLQTETTINKKIMVQLHQDLSEKNLKLAYIENKDKQTEESKKIIETLKMTNEHLYLEINELKENLVQLNKEKEQNTVNYKNELILKDSESEKLLKEKTDNEKTINVLRKEKEEVTEKLKKLKTEYNLQKDEKFSLEKQLNTYSSENLKNKNMITELSIVRDNMNSEIINLKKQLDSFQKEIKSLNTIKEKNEKEIVKLTNKITKFENKLLKEKK